MFRKLCIYNFKEVIMLQKGWYFLLMWFLWSVEKIIFNVELILGFYFDCKMCQLLRVMFSMPNNCKLHLLLILTVHSRFCRLFHMNIIVRFLSIKTRISEPCILLTHMPTLMSQLSLLAHKLLLCYYLHYACNSYIYAYACTCIARDRGL